MEVKDADNNTAKTLTVEFNVLPFSSSIPSASPTLAPTESPTQTQTPTPEPSTSPTGLTKYCEQLGKQYHLVRNCWSYHCCCNLSCSVSC